MIAPKAMIAIMKLVRSNVSEISEKITSLAADPITFFNKLAYSISNKTPPNITVATQVYNCRINSRYLPFILLFYQKVIWRCERVIEKG
jgi:hypothetical protein